MQWGFSPQIETTGGILLFNSGQSNATFTAVSDAAIPEPITVMSAVIGFGMIGGYIRKRRAA
jgi:hypothetical protein